MCHQKAKIDIERYGPKEASAYHVCTRESTKFSNIYIEPQSRLDQAHYAKSFKRGGADL